MIIHTKSYPRAAVIGNPSDGYFGKTIAFVFRNFAAEITLYQTPELEIIPNAFDNVKFNSISELFNDVNLHGYYGGIRLLKAAVKRFYQYCKVNSIELDNRNFTIRYSSNIPMQLGLAGSSAIITACMKALMAFFSIDIPKPILANVVLSVEMEELGISAGLQDRVAQAFETPVFMDFNKEVMKSQGYGHYQPLKIKQYPNFYIGYRTDLAEGSEVVHNNFRERYNNRDKDVLEAITQWSELTIQAKECLESGDFNIIGLLMNKNFDIRRKVMKISAKNIEMVETARSVGASAKFTGSGGAIIGTYSNDSMFSLLEKNLGELNVSVIKPEIVF